MRPENYFLPVSRFVVNAFTGDVRFVERANFKRKWLRRRPVFRGLVCFFGSAMVMFSSFRFYNKLSSYYTAFYACTQGIFHACAHGVDKSKHKCYNASMNKEVPTTPRHETKEPLKLTERGKVAVATVLIGATALAGCGALKTGSHPESGSQNILERTWPPVEHDEDVTHMAILEGANVRSDPNTTGRYQAPNILDKTSEEIIIDTPEGVYITSDDNGNWYGVDIDTLNEESIEALDNEVRRLQVDQDGIIWVNHQRAIIERPLDPEDIS